MGQSMDALAEEEAKRQEKLALNNVYKKYIYNANDQEPGGELAEEGRGEERKPYIYLPYDQIEQEAVREAFGEKGGNERDLQR